MRTFMIVATVLSLAGCHNRDAGERCNPSQFSGNGVQGDCEHGLACVYPTAPSCGVAYCCKLDDNGNVSDDHDTCQADPSLAGACGLDLATSEEPPNDAGE